MSDLNPDGSIYWPCATCGKGTWPCDCPCTDPRCATDLTRARREALEEAAQLVEFEAGTCAYCMTPRNLAAELRARALAGTPDATKEETT